MTDAEATDPRYWAEHLRKPVRFSDAVTNIWNTDPDSKGDPSRILIELGPRRTLATLAKQHATDPKNQLSLPSLSDNSENNAEWRAMMSAVAQLWTAGATIPWEKLSGDGKDRTKMPHVTIPTYAFQRKPYFVEPGYAMHSPANGTVRSDIQESQQHASQPTPMQPSPTIATTEPTMNHTSSCSEPTITSTIFSPTIVNQQLAWQPSPKRVPLARVVAWDGQQAQSRNDFSYPFYETLSFPDAVNPAISSFGSRQVRWRFRE